MRNKLQLFDIHQILSVWDEEQEKRWFSVLDIIAVLTDQPDYKKVRSYWKWLKNKLKEEGSSLFFNPQDNELVSNTNQLKLLAPDGKMRLTEKQRPWSYRQKAIRETYRKVP
jgi:cell filamentation protein